MNRVMLLKGVSWVSSVLFLLGKSADSQSAQVQVSKEAKNKVSISQFGDQDRIGAFSMTHVDCKPTNHTNQILVTEDALLAEDSTGNFCELIGRIAWNGFEARSSWLSPEWLRKKGLVSNCSLYCRPIQMPGGTSLWLSFLPDQESRSPYRDEIYRRAHL
ncbi:MAG: hypothetical protein KGQ59_01250 [Bdellovibrionales bacterium]|nr:hypothetical protein [Bdellovibrionales bacterium]